MPVLGTRLRQIVGPALNVGERRDGRIPPGNAVEAAAPLVRFAPARGLDGFHGAIEERPHRIRHEVVVEERHLVVAGVALAPQKPCARANRQPLGREQLPDARVIGHLREGAGVRPPATAAAGAAVVRRLVRVVEADRPVSDHEHERRQPVVDAEVLQHPADDVGHLAHGEARVLPDRRRLLLAVQTETGAAGAERRLPDAPPA